MIVSVLAGIVLFSIYHYTKPFSVIEGKGGGGGNGGVNNTKTTQSAESSKDERQKNLLLETLKWFGIVLGCSLGATIIFIIAILFKNHKQK